MTNILIVAGGNFPENINISKLSEKNEIIIAVDKGYELLFNNNIKPDYLLGDFDSISKNLKIDSNINKIKYPSEKSMTDLEIGIELAIELKAHKVTIIGATGTRLDHTFINIILLKKLFDNNIKGEILDDNNLIYIIKNYYEVESNEYKYLSIIPLYKDTIVSLKGVKYPLDKNNIRFGSSLGISNEIIEEKAYVEVNNYALLFLSND